MVNHSTSPAGDVTSAAAERYEFAIIPPERGERLDLVLSRRMVFPTRSQVKRVIEQGLVTVNRRVEKAGYRVREGEIVCVIREPVRPAEAEPEDLPLAVVYEDDDIIVVDKPAGMVVHPAAGNYRGTLVNALLFHCPNLSGIGGVARPGIVHRLDKQTSGLMVVAKSDQAHEGLSRQFKGHRIEKEYTAFVYGDPPGDEGVIELSIGRHPVDRKKMSTKSRRGKRALTRWSVRERFGVVALLVVKIETGRTHQIRVHLQTLGHPVVGDSVYGNAKKRIDEINDNELRTILKSMKRQALHSSRIGFLHPRDNRALEFSIPLPDDMASLHERLRAYGGRGT